MIFFRYIIFFIFVFVYQGCFAEILNFDSLIGQKDSLIFTSKNKEISKINVLLNNGNRKKALVHLYQLIDHADLNNDTLVIVESHLLLADILRGNGDYHHSNKNLNIVIPFAKKDYDKLQYIYFKKGGNFQNDGQIDSALVNYKRAIKTSEKVALNEDLQAKMHANLAGIYYLKANYNKAIEHSKIAANFQKILGNSEIEAGILNNLGSIYFMKGQFKKALEQFKHSLAIVGYGQSDLQKQARNSSYINMAYAYSGLKNYKQAFIYQDKYFSLNDSLQQEFKYREIADIKSKYNVDAKKKEAEIEKQKRKEAEYLTFGLGIAIVILLLVIYILFKIYRLNKKNNRLKINHEKLINDNKIEALKSEAQSKILVATLDGRLEERKKISDILHGNVCALLSAANMHLYTSELKLNGSAPGEIQKTKEIIEEASNQVRTLSHQLISADVIKLGLSLAVKNLCKKTSNSNFNLNYEAINISRFNKDFEIKIFNILNEFINNMLKHSQASEGSVMIEQLNGQLQLRIFDNGKGFDVHVNQVDGGIGLSQVKARIRGLNGILNINSTSKGTRIFASIPIVY